MRLYRHGLSWLALLALLLVLLPSGPAGAAGGGPITLVRDINLTLREFSSNPENIVVAGENVYFVATSPTYGKELWRAGGGSTGVSLVADIYAGPIGSEPLPLGTAGDRLLFFASDLAHERRLWATDGSPAGTLPLTDFASNVNTSFDLMTANFGGAFYLALPIFGSNQKQLWRSDGTPAGTAIVDNLSPDWIGADGRWFYYTADGALWRSDGSAANAIKLKDLPGSISDVDWVATPHYLYFTYLPPEQNQRSLWRTDGTPEGTIKLVTQSSGQLGALTPAGDRLYFFASDQAHGTELWMSDGTPAGTHLVRDILPGTLAGVCYSCEYPGSQILADGKAVYFIAQDGPRSATGLWRSDGTAAGTKRVLEEVDYILGRTSGGLLLHRWLGRPELLSFDPATGATLLLSEHWISERSVSALGFASLDGVIYFGADDGRGSELWRSDGTPAGTFMAGDASPAAAAGANPSELTLSDRRIYFVADDGIHGHELWWVSRGQQPRMVVDLAPGNRTPFVNHDGGLTAAELTPIDRIIYFEAFDDRPFSSDGTAAGTKPDPLACVGCVKIGNTLFFAGQGPEGVELWRREGRKGPARLVKDLNPGEQGSHPSLLTPVGNELFLSAYNGTLGSSLWRSDGTPEGTIELWADPALTIERIVALGQTVFFVARDRPAGAVPTQLWRSDGTPEGTILIEPELNAGRSNGDGAQLTAAGDRLYLTLTDPEHGLELWTSDGIPGSLRLVRDIYPGPGSSNPHDLRAVGGRLLFGATDPEHGDELWRSDGTPEGTWQLADLAPGLFNSWPGEFTALEDLIYFRADDNLHGAELWSMPAWLPATPAESATLLDDFNHKDGALSTRWRGEGREGYQRRAGRLLVTTGGPIYWPERFGENQAAYVRLAELGPSGSYGLLLKVESRNDVRDWRQGALRVSYEAGLGQVVVSSYQPGLGWQELARLSTSFVAGDLLGARALSDGRVQVFRGREPLGEVATEPSNGGFFGAGQRGYVGLWLEGAAGAAIDDFGGGSLR